MISTTHYAMRNDFEVTVSLVIVDGDCVYAYTGSNYSALCLLVKTEPVQHKGNFLK